MVTGDQLLIWAAVAVWVGLAVVWLAFEVRDRWAARLDPESWLWRRRRRLIGRWQRQLTDLYRADLEDRHRPQSSDGRFASVRTLSPAVAPGPPQPAAAGDPNPGGDDAA